MAERKPTFIVAEIGVNHGGSLLNAYSLIYAAYEAKVDAVKFQAWKHGRFPDLEKYRLNSFKLEDTKTYADSLSLKWFCTPFDFESIDFLNELGMDIWKVPSGMMTNIEYLEKLKLINPKRIFLSTGMADPIEINKVIKVFKSKKQNLYSFLFKASAIIDNRYWINAAPSNMTILHCNTIYPTLFDDVNIKAISTLRNIFSCRVGLSDHTLGIEIPIAAVALGASVIEKHFTLDRNMPGPDQKMSLEPDELKAMVKAIRNVELAMGDGIKRPTPSELKVRDEIRERMKL